MSDTGPLGAEHIQSVVHRYLELVGGGTADQIVELFADDATVEDPVGGEVHIGRHAIRGFYKNIESLPRRTELITLRVAGHEAAFLFAITVGPEGGGMRIEPIDVMVFNNGGKITAMKAYWSPAHISQV
jgi:steroid delta-isomerase